MGGGGGEHWEISIRGVQREGNMGGKSWGNRVIGNYRERRGKCGYVERLPEKGIDKTEGREEKF
jgi:hypothetical protein